MPRDKMVEVTTSDGRTILVPQEVLGRYEETPAQPFSEAVQRLEGPVRSAAAQERLQKQLDAERYGGRGRAMLGHEVFTGVASGQPLSRYTSEFPDYAPQPAQPSREVTLPPPEMSLQVKPDGSVILAPNFDKMHPDSTRKPKGVMDVFKPALAEKKKGALRGKAAKQVLTETAAPYARPPGPTPFTDVRRAIGTDLMTNHPLQSSYMSPESLVAATEERGRRLDQFDEEGNMVMWPRK